MLTQLASFALLGLATVAQAQLPCNPADPLTPPVVCSIRAAFGPLVPSIVPRFLPTGILTVGYDNIAAIGGAQQLTPERVASPPRVSYNATAGTTSGPQFLILMIDPDAPTPQSPTSSPILHWMVSNLQVDATTLALGAGTALAPYAGPNPPQGSTFHRYVILLFSQPAGWTPPAAVASLPATVSGARLNFDWQAFVANANLGEPVGGMWFGSAYTGAARSGTGSDPATLPVTAAGGVATPSSVAAAAASVPASSTTAVTRMSTSVMTRGTTTVVVPASQTVSASATSSRASSPAAKVDANVAYAFLVGGFAAMFEGILH